LNFKYDRFSKRELETIATQHLQTKAREKGKMRQKIISTVTLPFRAIHFASALICDGHTHIITKTLASTLGNAVCLPWMFANRRHNLQCTVKLMTDFPIAYDSPDHLTPYGTALNNKSNAAFIRAMTTLYGRGSFLDLGCSGGKLVQDFSNVGWIAVGLDGSDYSRRHKRAAWANCHNLFTCDISKPFKLSQTFDVITAWDVLEHLTLDGLKILMANVSMLMSQNSIFIVTTANNSDKALGIELHQTQWNREQWRNFFKQEGFNVTDPSRLLRRWEMVRHSCDKSEFLITK
jgi:SAM-dependent methyltransferase